MRLFEVEDRFANDLETILRNVVGRNDATDKSLDSPAPQPIKYSALSQLLRNMGYAGITPDLFKKIYDKNDGIRLLVKDPDETGEEVVLKTKAEQDTQQVSSAPGPDIDAMAKQGANAYQSKLS